MRLGLWSLRGSCRVLPRSFSLNNYICLLVPFNWLFSMGESGIRADCCAILRDIGSGPNGISEMVDHIFHCVSALRQQLGESDQDYNRFGGDLDAARAIVAALTSDAGKVLREMICGSNVNISCPAHGPLETVHVGSVRHKQIFENDLKMMASSKLVCRNCSRDGISQDILFNFCSTCKYIRCLFCVKQNPIRWKTVINMICASPEVAQLKYPGERS